MKNVLLIFVFSFIAIFSNAQGPIIIDSTSAFQIGKSLEYYIPKEEMNIEEVYKAPFSKFKEDVPNLGVNDLSVWIKFSLINNSSYKYVVLSIDNPTLTEVEFFQKKSIDDHYESTLLNKSLPISARDYKTSDYSFWIENSDKEPSAEYFLRIKSEQPLILPININLPPDELKQITEKNWINGIYFGIIISMALYNLFIFISVRDKSYLYYVLFISFTGLTQLTLQGISYQYFWPSFPFLESYGMIFLASASGIFSLIFTNNFLHLRNSFPKFKNLLNLLIIPFAISIFLLFMNKFDLAFTLMRLNTALSAISIFLIAIFVVKKRKGMSDIYFLISWSFLILGSLIYILHNYGILHYNLFTNHSVQLTSSMEMILLSFALANRINLLKKEKELARLSALKEAYRSEQIIKKQNIILEKKVKERTMELRHSNEFLETSLSSLKEAQSHLVFAEKMSSLGQLTAGIAHEINNPINFVASSILPLERDIDILVETMAEIEKIHSGPLSSEEKEQAIADLKEENDIDYTLEELNSLIKGIKDGAKRTATIVKSLRTFSRIDQSESNNVDLNEGLEATIVIAKNELHNIKLNIDLADLPKIYCSAGKLNQVFLNLITNAAYAIRQKFNGQTGGELSIQTKYTDKHVLIVIEDNGIGMSQETKENIFNPFYTTKDVGEGTGLGMSISSSILDQHKGQILVESEEGVGTSITLQIPIN